MAARDDEDYPELIRKIETESEFEKLGQKDPHKCYTQRGKELRILNTMSGDLVYVDYILVPPV